MKKLFSIYRCIRRPFCALLCIFMLASIFCLFAGADTVRSYTVTVDHPKSALAKNMPVIINNYVHGTDDVLKLAGWIKTDLVMKYYEYTLDGGKTWIDVTDAVVSRPDLKTICPNTYQTAGFQIHIDVSGLLRGQYDLFLRGITTSGDVIDALAMLNVSIGQTDTDTIHHREINLNALGAQNGTLSLSANTPLSIGAHNLREFEGAEILLDSNASLTLRAADQDSPYRFSLQTDTATQNEDGTYTATVNWSDLKYAGELLLSSQTDVNVLRIRLLFIQPDFYTGDMQIFMTAGAYDYLGGANHADAELQTDDIVGTFTHFFPVSNTNDPFVYFNIGNYLSQTQNIEISADHYRYAVITLQTPATNSPGLFRLFLCAGAIRGPSGDSHIAFQATNDGKWHRYVIPLFEENDWIGKIHGIRFDFIDGNANPADFANIASLGFYPDLESAQAAANKPFEVYHENGNLPEDKYKEEGRAPSGKADAITYFDDSLASCFVGNHETDVTFDEYGHLLLHASNTTNDPYVTFDMQAYATINNLPLLNTSDCGIIVLRILADKNIQGKNFFLYYHSGGLNYAEGTRSVHAVFKGDEWEYLVYDMSEKPYWTDQILGLRLDFATQINAGQKVCVSDILFFADMKAWHAFAAQNGVEIEGETQPLPNQTEPPETERPTIEIPTNGPGLEYIPPETQSESTFSEGCAGSITCPVLLALLPVFFIFGYQFKLKKGDRS